VAVVGPDNKVEMRPIQRGQAIDESFVIEKGVKAGERVRGGRHSEGPAGYDGRSQALRGGRKARDKPRRRPPEPSRVQFFINRPIVAMVIAIITLIGGIVILSGLPIAQFPDIVPPQITHPPCTRARTPSRSSNRWPRRSSSR
jgi:hypothetical protein